LTGTILLFRQKRLPSFGKYKTQTINFKITFPYPPPDRKQKKQLYGQILKPDLATVKFTSVNALFPFFNARPHKGNAIGFPILLVIKLLFTNRETALLHGRRQ